MGFLRRFKEDLDFTVSYIYEHRKRYFLVVGFICFAFSIFEFLFPNLVVNTSPSVGGFLFWKEEIESGDVLKRWDYVLVKPPDEYSRMLSGGGYILKLVGCLPGEMLFIDEHGFYRCENGHESLIFGRAMRKDSRGTRLHVFVYRGVVPKDSYFLVGNDPKSYDSKYFGFVKKEEIVARAVRIF